MATAPPIVPPYVFTGGLIIATIGKNTSFRFQITDQFTGSIADLTGWPNFHFMAKTNVNDPDTSAVFSYTKGAGITVIQPLTAGTIEVDMGPNDFGTLASQTYHFFAELQGVDNLSLIWTLWQGELDVVPAIVQAQT